ncbi:nucleoside ABC transporter membrane protein [Desulfonatronum thiosulfatophilum]|uniref:Nucleoside ABC transporter membrane protein n=1 Tax=Desulfonatronum thiosulfatophilum TaxID=617002 RepID=A0A1G6A9H2_9BACT|nr:ABC transporter permease [Desulfonatronum thiosulfatophilum]SDB04976.1 nucleoside ABC transporter membrane protein [Desulfonatronum thiosulfatophilum]
MPIELIIALLAAAVQSGTPILYATLGEMVTEKSGVLNLGVEGMMMVGALGAFWFSLTTGSPWLGFLMGGFCAAMLAALHGMVCLGFQGNQVVSGLALTILGTGLANFLGTPLIGSQGIGFFRVPLPVLSDIPVLGPILFNHDVLVYLSFGLPVLIWLFFRHTRLGLHLRSVGENPAAAATAGLNVIGLRWLGIIMGGFLVGLGGAYLSLAYIHLWTSGLTAGRGWIAVALVIFSFWRPGRAVFGAYLFGGVMAFQLRLQATGTDIPSSFLLMLPYALTILVLVASTMTGRGSAAPAALGVNIPPEE